MSKRQRTGIGLLFLSPYMMIAAGHDHFFFVPEPIFVVGGSVCFIIGIIALVSEDK